MNKLIKRGSIRGVSNVGNARRKQKLNIQTSSFLNFKVSFGKTYIFTNRWRLCIQVTDTALIHLYYAITPDVMYTNLTLLC